MRIFTLLFLLSAVGTISAGGKHTKLDAAKPISVSAEGSLYGAALTASMPATELTQALAHAGDYKEKPAAFSGSITQVCQKQGCWLVLTDGADFARVTMHDHSFAVPKDASGDAVVYGTLSEAELSKAEADHLAEDGGEAARPKQQREFRIDATSVLIRPSQP